MSTCPKCTHEISQADFWPGPGGRLSNRFQCSLCDHRTQIPVLRDCDTCFWKETPCDLCVYRSELGPNACATRVCRNSQVAKCWICTKMFCETCIQKGMLSGNPICATCRLKDRYPLPPEVKPLPPLDIETRPPAPVEAWGLHHITPLDRLIHRTTGYKPLSTKED